MLGKKLQTGISTLLLIVLGTACLDVGNPVDAPLDIEGATPSDADLATGTVDVLIRNLKFEPKEITVAAGTTVRWIMEDTGTFHFVTEGDPNQGTNEFKSPQLNIGDSWEYTFTVPGTYVYHCSNHSTVMRNAKVIVE